MPIQRRSMPRLRDKGAYSSRLPIWSQQSSPRNNVASAKTLKQKYSTNYVENNNNSTVTCDFDSDSHSAYIPESEAYSMFKMNSEFRDTDQVTIMVTIEDSLVQMEIDTGASVSLISQQAYDTLWSNKNNKPDLEECTDVFKTYTGEAVPALGKLNVNVIVNDQQMILPLYVALGKCPNLLGRNWLGQLRLNWKDVHDFQRSKKTGLETMLQKYSHLFDHDLGEIKGVCAKIYVNENAVPKFCKARPLPYAMKDKVSDELDHLEKQGIIQKVKSSDWAAPVVPVIKSDGRSLRLCGDYKVTINAASKCHKYPIPRIEDIYATLSGGKIFSKIDLSNAYLQVPLHEDSRKFTTINTHKGLYQYTRLLFGVSSSPGIYQRSMDDMLRGISGVCT